MPGDSWQRFANLRAYFAFMWTHPGKKLLFMGGEFAPGARMEPRSSASTGSCSSDPLHAGVQRLVRDLNRLYRATPALHELDCEPAGSRWIDADDARRSVISYLRARPRRRASLPSIVVQFHAGAARTITAIGVPQPGRCRELLNTDCAGLRRQRVSAMPARSQPNRIRCTGMPIRCGCTLPPLGVVIFTAEP